MGIKENFTQALKELAGTGKDNKDNDKAKSSQVEDLRRALESEVTVNSADVNLGDGVPDALQEEAILPTSFEPEEEPVYAPKGGHAGLDLNIQELRQTNDSAEQFFNNSAQNEPSPVSSPFGQTSFPSPSTRNEPSPVNGNGNGNGNGINSFSTAMAEAMGEASDVPEELTIISKNTVIEGNVRSFANMSIEGNIRGDIETTKNIDLNGKVIGNLTCNNAQMLTSQIQGNVRMKGNILMGRDTLLIGDLVSTYAKVNGKVKGNLEIGGKAELKSDAVIFGDISASTITVDDGAIIQGYVSTTFLNKEESRNIFPEAISIAE